MSITRGCRRWAALATACMAVVAAGFIAQALAVPPANASSGATVYTADSAYNSDTAKFVGAKCPAGTRVLGGGGQLLQGQGRVALTTTYPYHNPNEDGYVAVATELRGGYSGSWFVRAYAICGNLDGLEIVIATSSAPSGAQFKTAEARCTAPRVPIGSGAGIGYPERGVTISSVVFGSVSGGSGVRVGAAEDRTDGAAAPADFGIVAWAVCAFTPSGYETQWKIGSEQTSNMASAHATCSTGKVSLGAGMILVDYTSTSHTENLYPDRRYAFIVASRRSSSTQPWHVYSQAVCSS